MNKLLILVFCWFSNLLYGQFGEEQIITTFANGAKSVYAGDIDNDSDIDVISASENDNTIAWYENLNGLGDFSSARVVTQTLQGTNFLSLSDLDGDNDLDILTLSSQENRLVWYRNMDGLGNFSADITITNNVDNPQEIIAADLDGDGDLDVVSASRDDNKISWYRNIDGLGNFSSQIIISSTILVSTSVFASDLNGDSFLDIIVSSAGEQKILWYQNLNGNGDFGGENEISNISFGINSVFAIDVDGDNDNDVLSALTGGNAIDWFENLNGNGSFGPQQIITSNIQNGVQVFATDLDNDLDADILSASAADAKIAWYENDGTGVFSNQKIISNNALGAWSVYAEDIDGDGLKDVISASANDDKIAWYKNEILSVPDTPSIAISLSPNPTKDLLFIKNKERIEITQIRVYNLLSSMVLKPKPTENTIDLTVLSKGLYLVQIITEKGIITQKVVKK